MRNMLNFASAQRRTKSTAGITDVTMISTDKAGETSQDIGTIVRAAGVSAFNPITVDGENLGDFDTRNLAAGELKRDFQRANAVTEDAATTEDATDDEEATDDEATVTTVSLEEAAATLCPNAKNPLSALKKKIRRGSVETVDIDGETRVVL